MEKALAAGFSSGARHESSTSLVRAGAVYGRSCDARAHRSPALSLSNSVLTRIELVEFCARQHEQRPGNPCGYGCQDHRAALSVAGRLRAAALATGGSDADNDCEKEQDMVTPSRGRPRQAPKRYMGGCGSPVLVGASQSFAFFGQLPGVSAACRDAEQMAPVAGGALVVAATKRLLGCRGQARGNRVPEQSFGLDSREANRPDRGRSSSARHTSVRQAG
jgi:hypothetical protein